MDGNSVDRAEPIGILAVIAAAELLALTLWFSATAAAPTLKLSWGLSTSDIGALTISVQLGFVAGALLFAILNVPDLIRSRHLFAICAVVGAASNAWIATLDGSQLPVAVLLRFVTGVSLAGVYPSGLKVMAGWFRRGRGMAMGVLVGAVTVGSATPHLVQSLGLGWQEVLCTSSGLAVLAAILMLQTGDGPFETPSRPFRWNAIGQVLANRRFRLATSGYLGHMWELYAMWTWISAWLAVAHASRDWQPSSIPVLTFFIMASGGLGSWVAGLWADRAGRARAAAVSMLVSGGCALATPVLFHAPAAVVVPVLLLWGFSIVADSAQFSALVTEVVDDELRGTALTLQTALGFLLTIATIHLTSALSDAWGWRWAFPILAIGPALGVLAMVRAQRA